MNNEHIRWLRCFDKPDKGGGIEKADRTDPFDISFICDLFSQERRPLDTLTFKAKRLRNRSTYDRNLQQSIPPKKWLLSSPLDW